MCVSKGIPVSQYVLSEEWNFLKMHVSEIRVKRICVNQGLGVVVYVNRTLKLQNCIYSIAQYLARASEKSDAKIMTSNIGRARGLIR